MCAAVEEAGTPLLHRSLAGPVCIMTHNVVTQYFSAVHMNTVIIVYRKLDSQARYDVTRTVIDQLLMSRCLGRWRINQPGMAQIGRSLVSQAPLLLQHQHGLPRKCSV